MDKKDRFEKLKELAAVPHGEGREYETHKLADEILCELLTELGYGEWVKLWEQVPKWYS